MKTKTDSFCVFIISHGRPDKVITLRTLAKARYAGSLFIVCDNEDKTVDQYRKNYGADKVVVFDKLKYAAMVDSCDNFQDRRTTTHARNACFDIAAEKGFDFFLVLDDDYTSLMHNLNPANEFKRSHISNSQKIFKSMILFLTNNERINTICFLQGGDLIGGDWNGCVRAFPFLRRKAMNSFFCKTDRRFWFFSRLNEDVNTYLALGKVGGIFLTIPEVALNQSQTQSTAGGMSDAYIASGTYVKSFYTVMICPSFAKVSVPSSIKAKTINRIHHKIRWNNAVPKILDDCHKKL